MLNACTRHEPLIRAGYHDMCMNPDVVFKAVFKIVFYKILILIGIKFITETDFFNKALILI